MANKFTTEDFYGADLDGKNRKIDVRFMGYVGNRLYEPDGAYHPCSLETEAIETMKSPDGALDYDEELGLLTFQWATNSRRIYKIQYVADGYAN
jgi:hypothetical protein